MPSERHRKRRLRRACVGGAAGALVLVGAAGSSTPPRLRGTVLERSLYSAALKGRLRFELYLPPGYPESTARYPVVYFLHGLPASPYAFRGIDTVTQALDRSRRRAILVPPQGARDGDDDPEYLDWGPGRNWETALGEELPHLVDAHFRTIANRRGRALRLGRAPAHLLRLLRRPRGRALPRREPAAPPGARRRACAARVRGLPGCPRADALEHPRPRMASACAGSPREGELRARALPVRPSKAFACDADRRGRAGFARAPVQGVRLRRRT
jgi:hypothetical protein